jgi:excisionase family DNA binding protein
VGTQIENISIAEAVRLFGIGRTKLYGLIQSGEVEAFKLGRRTLIKVQSMQALFAALPRIGGQP